MRVVGDGAAVERNRLTTSSGPGIDARGTRFRVARNPVFGTDG